MSGAGGFAAAGGGLGRCRRGCAWAGPRSGRRRGSGGFVCPERPQRGRRRRFPGSPAAAAHGAAGSGRSCPKCSCAGDRCLGAEPAGRGGGAGWAGASPGLGRLWLQGTQVPQVRDLLPCGFMPMLCSAGPGCPRCSAGAAAQGPGVSCAIRSIPAASCRVRICASVSAARASAAPGSRLLGQGGAEAEPALPRRWRSTRLPALLCPCPGCAELQPWQPTRCPCAR